MCDGSQEIQPIFKRNYRRILPVASDLKSNKTQSVTKRKQSTLVRSARQRIRRRKACRVFAPDQAKQLLLWTADPDEDQKTTHRWGTVEDCQDEQVSISWASVSVRLCHLIIIGPLDRNILKSGVIFWNGGVCIAAKVHKPDISLHCLFGFWELSFC